MSAHPFLVLTVEVLNEPVESTRSWRSMISQSTNPKQFEFSRIQEINGLVDRGVFTLVPLSDEKGSRLHDARFLESVKTEGTSHAFPESRFVVMAFNDTNHGLLTAAPTVQRSSQHILLSLFGTKADFVLYTKDILQAYT